MTDRVAQAAEQLANQIKKQSEGDSPRTAIVTKVLEAGQLYQVVQAVLGQEEDDPNKVDLDDQGNPIPRTESTAKAAEGETINVRIWGQGIVAQAGDQLLVQRLEGRRHHRRQWVAVAHEAPARGEVPNPEQTLYQSGQQGLVPSRVPRNPWTWVEVDGTRMDLYLGDGYYAYLNIYVAFKDAPSSALFHPSSGEAPLSWRLVGYAPRADYSWQACWWSPPLKFANSKLAQLAGTDDVLNFLDYDFLSNQEDVQLGLALVRNNLPAGFVVRLDDLGKIAKVHILMAPDVVDEASS